MVLSFIGYATLIALFLAAAGSVADCLFAELGAPRRWAWLPVLVASVALPGYFVLLPASEPAVTISAEFEGESSAMPASPGAESRSSALPVPDLDWPVVHGLDRVLGCLWGAASALLLLVYGATWMGLCRAVRGWPSAQIDGSDVVVSDRLGPAVFGVLEPQIIVPEWLIEADTASQSMALAHEREHIAEHDAFALLIGLLAVIATPWNLPMWWQLRRLRFAIEVDCDNRVTRRGFDRYDYAHTLLCVSEHGGAARLGMIALTEPPSQLERRIRQLLDDTGRFRPLVVAACAVLAVALVIGACTINSPQAASDSIELEAQAQGGDPARYTPAYNGIDIRMVIEAMAQVTGRNFVIDPEVDARVTWVSETPLSRSDLYSDFVALLQAYDFAVVDEGDFVQVRPAAPRR